MCAHFLHLTALTLRFTQRLAQCIKSSSSASRCGSRFFANRQFPRFDEFEVLLFAEHVPSGQLVSSFAEGERNGQPDYLEDWCLPFSAVSSPWFCFFSNNRLEFWEVHQIFMRNMVLLYNAVLLLICRNRPEKPSCVSRRPRVTFSIGEEGAGPCGTVASARLRHRRASNIVARARAVQGS